MISRNSLFMQRIICFLIPFFAESRTDMEAAAEEILETLASYGARTRAEIINAAKIIAYSMTALETLSEAKSGDLSPSLRIRFRGCANSLDRAAIRCEKALNQQLARDPVAAEIAPEPINDVPDAEVEAALENVGFDINTVRNRLGLDRPQPDPNLPIWTGAIIKPSRLATLTTAA